MAAHPEWNFAGRIVERLGRGPALIDAATDHTVTGDQLAQLIAAYGNALLSTGLQLGDRVIIGCTLSPLSSLVYLGAIYAGLVAVPVDERMLASSASALVQATGAKAVWSESGVSEQSGQTIPARCLKGELAQSTGAVVPPASRTDSDLAALMATSGSTGVPRFVMVSHGNLLANTEAIIRSQALAVDERALLILPISYVFGASILHTHLYQGGSVVFDRRFMFPDKVLHSAARYNCTTFAGVPTVYNVLLRRSNIRQIPQPSLRRFLQAGGSLAAERVSEMRELFPSTRFYVMYGQTEATSRISCMDPGLWDQKSGSVGRPLDNLTIAIVDERGNPVPLGQVGELIVHGPSICLGYLNDPEESKTVFRNGWLHTQDLARQDEDGFLWIEGRIGSFFKTRGTRVSLAEIEAKVSAIPGVYECGVCSVAHPEAGEALVILIVPDRGVKLVPDEIKRRLPAQWTIDSIRLVADLPKTAVGKIARPALLALGKETNGTAQ